MAKKTSYPARELKRRRSAWMRRNAKLLAMVAGGVIGLGIIASLSLMVLPAPLRFYFMGAVHAGLLAAGLHLVNSGFLAHDQQAIRQVRGSWGEDNTTSELQGAKRKRLIWGWVDSVELQVGDIDHIVLTRNGGIVAIDSKWRNELARDHAQEMAASSKRAAVRARGVLQTVLTREKRERCGIDARSVSVAPVVVLWGAARTEVPPNCVVEGVRFLDGRQLLGWLAELEGEPMSRSDARTVIRLIEGYRLKVATESARSAGSRSRP